MASRSEPAVSGLVFMECFVPVGDDGMTPSTSLTLPGRLDGAVTPPFVDSPSLALDATQVLYFVKGNRSFTSSIVMSFFSLLLRCGLAGMFSKLIGSGSSPFRIARLRALYRKQYLTPTMIHRFVKTTPKPSATKNSSGELVGPPGLLFDWVIVGVGAVVVACDRGVGEATVDVWPELRFLLTISLPTT